MRILRSVVRWVLAVEAFIFLVGGAEVGWKALPRYHQLHPERSLLLFEILWGYAIITGLVAAFAAWRIKRPGRWWEGLVVSLMNLVWIPLGPILSAAGLFYFFREPAPDPVRDREHKPVAGDGTSRWSGVAFLVAQVVWVWLVYSRLLHWTAARGMQRTHSDPGTWFLVLGLAIYTSIVIHELGHFALGRAVGFRLVSFRLGPLNWMYRAGRWRLRLQPHNSLGGAVAMVPENANDIRKQAMIMTLGGPLGSAALGAVGFALLLAIPGAAWPVALGEFVVLIASMGFSDFVLNLFPVASGVSYSDGARVWQLYRRGPWADYLCAIYYMGLSRTTMLRPGDWPTEMVEHTATFASAAPLPNAAAILAMAYAHFEDRGDLERAASYLERACASVQPGTETALNLAVDRAYFEAFHRRNSSEGARWLDPIPEKKESCDYWRSKAAVLAANGELRAAEEAWRRGWELTSKLPEAGVYEMDRRQYRMIADRLREIAEPQSPEPFGLVGERLKEKTVPALTLGLH